MNILRKTLLTAAAVLMVLGAAARRPVARHVVFIGFDGWAANTFTQSDMPVVKALAARGALTLSKRSVLPSASAINWASIFMGVPTEVHGYLHWNSAGPDLQQPEGAVSEHGIMPTIFQVVRRQHPGANLAVFAEWDGIMPLVDTLALDRHELLPFGQLTSRACEYIKEYRPELVAVIYDHPDHPGHDTGWGTPEYYDMMRTLDAEVGKIVAAVGSAGMLEHTVFVLTADHGGKGRNHGGTSMDEMLSPFIVSGPGVRAGVEIDELVMSTDVAPTLAALLGVRPAAIWTGRAPQSVFRKKR